MVLIDYLLGQLVKRSRKGIRFGKHLGLRDACLSRALFLLPSLPSSPSLRIVNFWSMPEGHAHIFYQYII